MLFDTKQRRVCPTAGEEQQILDATYLPCSAIANKHKLECRGRLSTSYFGHLRRSCVVIFLWFLIDFSSAHFHSLFDRPKM